MNIQKFTTLKTILIALVLTISTNQLFSQTTNGIFFQAVARDNFSNPAKDRKIYVQSSIIQTTPTGTKVLTEEHQANTDATGVFSISLGNGVRVGGTATSLATIDWSKGPYYLNLKVAITPIGGNSNWDYTKEWVDMGTTSFGAVPFALYSASSAKVDDKLNVSDTTTMLKVYAKAIKVQSLETAVASKLTAADTLTMLAPYAKAAYTIDSSFFKSQLATKLSLSDSTSYVTPTQLAAKTFDQTPITNAIATKLNIADSTKYVTPTQLAAKTFDTASLSNRINLKANNIDVINLTTKANSNTSNITSNTNSILSNTASITANTNSINSNTASITANTNSINSNTSSITSNTNSINSNTASITSNTNSILSNTASITANTNSINSNTASITANTTAIGLKLDANKVGVANGVASLNLNGLIPNNQIPAISFQSATVVTGEPAMLALNNAVVGSFAIRTDNSKNFVLSALPASTIGNWIELVSPASVTSVNGNAGPTVNLAAADIPGVEALVNKSTATNLGSTNPSDILYPTQKAVKTYVDAQTAAAGVLDGSITNAKLAGSITAGKLVGTDISIVGTIATGVWSATTIGLTKGGTGATNAADARTNLGLIIGTNVQAPLTAGTDYLTPTGSAASLTNFPTLNQNTTGNAATATLATNATYATTAGDITSTSNTTLTSLSNLNTVGTITTGTISLTTNIKTTNTLTTGAVTYPNIHGSNGQLLSTTGSGTLTWTTVSSTVNAGSISGTIAVANGGTGATTLTGYVKGTGTTAMTASGSIPVADVTGAAPLASPTFTGTVTTATINTGALSATSVTTPIYASTPQALTDGATISWNPTLGLNASVTLAGNRTLSFTSTPAVGSYGTLVVTQDATGGRTITLPSTTNKVLGSTSGTTIALSSAANAKDILNFYYDGTNCYWNIGQGYGAAATAPFTLTTTGTGAATLSGTTLNIPSVSSTVNSSSISGTVAVANGGTGVTTSTGTGNVVLSTSPTLITPALGTPSAVILTSATGLPLTTGVTGTLAVGNGGTGATTLTGYVKGTGTTAMTASANIPVADVTGAAPLASPTFTGTVTTSTINTGALSATSVTTPIYASTPQALTDGATISWNPTLGLNASVTLAGNRTLSFTSTPAVGSYGTVVLTQDGTGGRTITLPTIPSVTNKVLGSATNTTVSLSTAANAKDILNFYYDGTNCYWNIGQGYGAAATAPFTLTTTGTGAATLSGTTLNIPSVSSTVNSGSISGTIAVANGGTGASTQQASINALTGTQSSGKYLRSDGTNATLTTIQAADIPTLNQNTTGNAATATIAGNISGTVAVANGGTGNSTATQNFIFAGPATGSTAAAPGFRALVAADIPLTTISYGKIQNITAGKLLGSISSSAAAPGEVAIGSGLSLTNGTLAATSSGTVTSVAALTLGTTGTDVASTVVNGSTTPVITLNIPDASVSARGVVTTGVQTIAGAKTFSGAITAKNYITTVPANITAASTTALDFSTGNILKVSLGANITTLSVTNATAGTYLLEIIQGGTYTVAFPAAWKWSGGSAPTITATSGKTDIITIVYDGTTYFASAVQNF